MEDLFRYLSGKSYPGRGIIAGKYKNENVIAYFIMGRSANSRNRVFAMKDDILYTKAFDESLVEDPSLIIYNAVITTGEYTIVANGDQSDTIYNFMEDGKSFEQALDTREYEPDAPNYTPRISALISPGGSCKIEILKRKNEECVREKYEYEGESGIGHFISTYEDDGNPLSSFDKAPVEFEIKEDIESFAGRIWNSLDSQNKISLFVRYYNGDTKRDIILNKNE